MSHANDFARLCFTFFQAYEAHMEKHLAPTLTASHLTVLEYLTQLSQPKAADLIDYLQTTPAAVTTLIDRMQKAGLVDRSRDEHDKRIVRLIVTPTGNSEMLRGQQVRETFLQTQLNHLSTHNQQMLVYLFGKIVKFEQ
jgi:DNA-binding MarR family transcriptional regulator